MPMLKESLEEIDNIVEGEVRDRMGEEVSSWFNNEFSLADYVDIDDLVKEVIETKLSRATITVDL
jgi:hypothetical protein